MNKLSKYYPYLFSVHDLICIKLLFPDRNSIVHGSISTGNKEQSTPLLCSLFSAVIECNRQLLTTVISNFIRTT